MGHGFIHEGSQHDCHRVAGSKLPQGSGGYAPLLAELEMQVLEKHRGVDRLLLIEQGGKLFHPRIRNRDIRQVDLLIAARLLSGQGVEDRGFSAEGQADETGFHSSL